MSNICWQSSRGVKTSSRIIRNDIVTEPGSKVSLLCFGSYLKGEPSNRIDIGMKYEIRTEHMLDIDIMLNSCLFSNILY